MRFNGKDVIGLGVTMNKKGDVLALGKLLESTMANIEGNLPIGVDVEKVADQSKVVNYRYRRILAYLLGGVGGGAVG